MYLRRQDHVGPGGLPRDLDPVGERAGGGVGPARAAVLRDVLKFFQLLIPEIYQLTQSRDQFKLILLVSSSIES